MQTKASASRTAQLKSGQYFTPAFLCDFMLALAYRYQENPRRILEPACGDGIFLRRSRQLEAEQNNCKERQWVGIEPEPIAFKTISDWASALSPPHPSIQLSQRDFLTISPKQLEPFDLIIGNPPYVRQELLTQDKSSRLNQFQDYFSDYLQQFPEQKKLFSQKADLYQWFFLQAFQLLQPNGILTFVVSNSWLDTQFGKHLQHFLLHHFDWLALVESTCERWFEEAAINPVIIVLRKKSDKKPAEPCQFIRLRQPLKDWLPDSQSPTYWQTLQEQIQTLEAQPNLEIQLQTTTELHRLYQRNHWNLALRAPAMLQTLMRQDTLWQRLDQVGTVRYPLKTGINDFFYVNPDTITQWQIEPEFLRPTIRSSKTITTLTVHQTQLKSFVFHCAKPKEELLLQKKTGALQYIEWGEKQNTTLRQKRFSETRWPNVPSVQGNQPWYHLKRLPPAHLLCNRFIDQRFFFALCEGDFVEDQTFYGLTLFDPQKQPPTFMAGLLNSTLSCALLEFLGRASLGEGVLQFARCDMAAFPVINPDLYSPSEQLRIQEAFSALAQQPLKAWSQDWESPFRLKLDEAVLTPILKHLPVTTDAETLRNQLAQALLKRIQERKNMAQSVRKKKTTTQPL